jgi:hypothetical protein
MEKDFQDLLLTFSIKVIRVRVGVRVRVRVRPLTCRLLAFLLSVTVIFQVPFCEVM